MGQGASYAESSIQQSLVRLLTKEVDLEKEQLRYCEQNASHVSFPPARASTQPPPDTPTKAAVQEDNRPDDGHDEPPHLSALREEFGPLTDVTPAYYSIDELREALPLLPDTLWVSLHRITVLYLLDADGDGRVSRSDVAHFTDWAIENVPESVPSEQLAEALHAQAALHCWRRCLVRAAAEDEEAARTTRGVNGRPPYSSSSATTCQSTTAASSTGPTTSMYCSPRVPASARAGGGAALLTKSAMDSAAVHFSRWVLVFVAEQQIERHARRQTALRRARLIRRVQALTLRHGEPPKGTSRALSPVPGAAPDVLISMSPNTGGPSPWPTLSMADVLQFERDETTVDAMLMDTPARWRRDVREELFTASGVEEVYMALGVLESSGLSFWGFCRLLDASSATAVERALGLTSEQAEHEISCAAVLEALRRTVAINHLATSELGNRESPERTANPQTHVKGHMGGQDASDGNTSGASPPASRPPQSNVIGETAAATAEMTQSGEELSALQIPDFIVSRYVLQPCIFCFVRSYWELLQSIGFDPSFVGSGSAK